VEAGSNDEANIFGTSRVKLEGHGFEGKPHEINLKEAIQFCYDKTPNGWILKHGFEAWYEVQTTFRFPGWHMGFNLGKIQLFNLIEDAAQVHGASHGTSYARTPGRRAGAAG